jgi:hypothetical protein
MLATEARSALEQHGVPVTTIRARSQRMWEESAERKADFIEPLDARTLYRALHREAVLVLALGAVFVRRDPQRDPPARRQAVKLETFVAHKASYGLVRGSNDIIEAVADFEAASRSAPACTGIDDPRALPLHVFETEADWGDLGDPACDRRFASRYGRPASRCDDGSKYWERARHFHGGLSLTISRTQLPAGAHWDVSIDRGRATLYTTDEVWHLRSGRQEYVAVYPNAYVRRPGRSRCRCVWKAT